MDVSANTEPQAAPSKARSRYLAGLRAGWLDESLGIVEPEIGYPDDDPYLAGVLRGRAAWRREASFGTREQS